MSYDNIPVEYEADVKTAFPGDAVDGNGDYAGWFEMEMEEGGGNDPSWTGIHVCGRGSGLGSEVETEGEDTIFW